MQVSEECWCNHKHVLEHVLARSFKESAPQQPPSEPRADWSTALHAVFSPSTTTTAASLIPSTNTTNTTHTALELAYLQKSTTPRRQTPYNTPLPPRLLLQTLARPPPGQTPPPAPYSRNRGSFTQWRCYRKIKSVVVITAARRALSPAVVAAHPTPRHPPTSSTPPPWT